MVDIENDVFDHVYTFVKAMYPNVSMASERSESPSEFPFVSIEESGNTTYEQSLTGDGKENHSIVTFTVEVYSNKLPGRKKEARDIAQAVDLAMESLGITRTMMSPMPNMFNIGVYRIVARYRCVVGKDKTIYRR